LQKHLGFKCGHIGGGRSKTTGIIDIALLPTLARRGNIKDLTAGYGVMVADKCHHIAASVFFNVISEYLLARAHRHTRTPRRA
jgi:superfamily II DNA or RNA helicase